MMRSEDFTTMVRSALLIPALLLLLAPAGAAAQTLANRPVTLVVPSAAGGVVDVVARILQPELQKELGPEVTLIIENKPGGGGHIGAAAVAKANPDGHTLLVSAGSVLTSGVYRKLSYDPVSDLSPVAMVMTGSFMVVVPSQSPLKSITTLVGYARVNPGKLTYASSGTGNSTHIGAEMLKQMGAFDALHVPYRGSVPALQDLVGGRVDFFVDNKASAYPLVKSGALRILAVTSPKRLPELPDVPTVAESLPGYSIEGWIGVFAPRGTPAVVISRVEAAVKRSVENAEVIARIRDSAGEAKFMTARNLSNFMASERSRFAKVVDAARITAD